MNVISTLIWLLALPLVSAPVIYLVGRLFKRTRAGLMTMRWLAVGVLVAECWPLFNAARLFAGGESFSVQIGTVLFGFDGISLILAATTLVLGILVAIYSTAYMAGEVGEGKFFALLVAMIGSIIGLGCAADLFNLWVWFEAMAVTSYFLVAFYRDQRGSLEAGVKYIVQSATGSVLVCLGIALVFMQTGTLQLADILANAMPSPLLLAAGALFVIGFGVKAALVPMHTWLPDAHSQAPSGISAMLSGVVIEAGLIAMLRVLGALTHINLLWGYLLLGFGVINMLVGNLLALRQTQVKRLLAYSSLSHVGYMLVGFGAAVSLQQGMSASGSFYHFMNHAMMKGLAFLAAGALLYALRMSNGDHSPLLVSDLNGASKRYPLLAFGFSVAVLGLGGLPPLAGFMSKWEIFAGGFATGNLAVILVVVFAALNSVLSLGYYAPLVNRLYRREPAEIVTKGGKVSPAMWIPVLILTAAVVIFGIWPPFAHVLSIPAMQSLMAMFGG